MNCVIVTVTGVVDTFTHKIMTPIEHILEQMDSRMEKLLKKSRKTKDKKLKKKLQADVDALICEYYEWLEPFYNDLPFPQISAIRLKK